MIGIGRGMMAKECSRSGFLCPHSFADLFHQVHFERSMYREARGISPHIVLAHRSGGRKRLNTGLRCNYVKPFKTPCYAGLGAAPCSAVRYYKPSSWRHSSMNTSITLNSRFERSSVAPPKRKGTFRPTH